MFNIKPIQAFDQSLKKKKKKKSRFNLDSTLAEASQAEAVEAEDVGPAEADDGTYPQWLACSK